MCDSLAYQEVLLREVVELNPESLGAGTSGNYSFRYLDLGSVDMGSIDWSLVETTRFSAAPSRARRKVRSGDCLFGMVRPNLRSHAFISSNVSNVIASTGFSVLRARKDRLDARYLFHWIISDIALGQAESAAVGSNYPAVSESDIGKFRLRLPSLIEQRRIAEILDAADDQIQTLSDQLQKLGLIKKGLLTDLMTKGTRDSIAHWEFRTCGEALTLASGQPYAHADPGNGSVPIYGSSGLAGYGRLALSAGPTLVIGRVGEGGVGSVRYVAQPAWISDNALWAKWIHESWSPDFVALYLSWSDLRRHRSQTGQPLITQSVINPLPLPRPPLDEQKKIVTVVHAWSRQESAIRAELDKIRLLKQGLMDDLLTGRVRVPIS